ncbi:hypothetical protein [endosymbiont of Lamellibrachia barhami]|uniref:hypothetical protein n=1 Tax=endosymbiont of Lamellibrachia barhami TaxID=205975 RepID=UPI0015B12163|nr:hypothetical protein [endosymbiont of Lamellibrachia barhami]
MNFAVKNLSILLLIVVTGCASPVTRDQITPEFYSIGDKNISLAVIDKRPYVLTGDKSEKFEGLVRGAFGIPMTLDRPERPKEERFVDFLSNIIKEGFNDSGIEVNIIKVDKGTSVNDAIDQMADPRFNKAIIASVYESKWDAGGFKFRYQYDFDIYIADIHGKVIDHERFSGSQANKPSESHNLWDMHTIIYRGNLETMFKSPAIKNALLNSGPRP